MVNEKKLNLDGLAMAGSNAAKPDAESKPGTIDLSSVGGVLIPSPPAGSSKPVDISHLYGEHGGLVWAPSVGESSDVK